MRRARADLGIDVEIIDLGVTAGPNPCTNACLWLSVVAGASRILDATSEVADGVLFAEILDDLRNVNAIAARQLRHQARVLPRQDAVSAVAHHLRQYMCTAMVSAAGRARWFPWFANLGGHVNAPGGGGATIAQYDAHVRALRIDAFADHLNVVQVAEALSLRIHVISWTPLGAVHDWAVTTVGPAHPVGTILLGNNDQHYVWLCPTGGAPAPNVN